MGTLKPGAHYTYTKIGNVIYASEPGGDHRAIGWDYVPPDDDFIDWKWDDGQPSEQQEWHDYDPDC
jgi:hypothetical protein